MPAIRIEPMRLDDLEAVLEIERVSFASAWSRHAFLYELRENRVANLWVARVDTTAAGGGTPPAPPAFAAPSGSDVAGYLCVWAIADEVHVTNLAVHPALRRQGIGRVLLGALLDHYRDRGATRVILEVRPNNVEALGLYQGFGFRQVGRRKGYYFDTGEDALLLEAELGRGPARARNRELPRPLRRSL